MMPKVVDGAKVLCLAADFKEEAARDDHSVKVADTSLLRVLRGHDIRSAGSKKASAIEMAALFEPSILLFKY